MDPPMHAAHVSAPDRFRMRDDAMDG